VSEHWICSDCGECVCDDDCIKTHPLVEQLIVRVAELEKVVGMQHHPDELTSPFQLLCQIGHHGCGYSAVLDSRQCRAVSSQVFGLRAKVAEWEKVFGHLSKDPDEAGNMVNARQRELERVVDAAREVEKGYWFRFRSEGSAHRLSVLLAALDEGGEHE
jgi:hypothetical protein